MAKTLKHNSSRKNKQSIKNVKQLSRKNKINKMKGGDAMSDFIAKVKANDNSIISISITSPPYSRGYQQINSDNSDESDINLTDLSSALKSNTHITKFSFIGISMHVPKKLEILVNSFNSITDVTFMDCNIEDEGAKVLMNLLKTNNKIKNLNISQNNISDVGIEYIATGLKTSISIEELIITYNKFCNQGVLLLADALRENRSLKHLDIRYLNTYFSNLPDITHRLDDSEETIKNKIAKLQANLLNKEIKLSKDTIREHKYTIDRYLKNLKEKNKPSKEQKVIIKQNILIDKNIDIITRVNKSHGGFSRAYTCYITETEYGAFINAINNGNNVIENILFENQDKPFAKELNESLEFNRKGKVQGQGSYNTTDIDVNNLLSRKTLHDSEA